MKDFYLITQLKFVKTELNDFYRFTIVHTILDLKTEIKIVNLILS